jgi:hypothetical protein
MLKHCHDFTFIINWQQTYMVCGIGSRWGKKTSARREEKLEGRVVRTDILRKDTRFPAPNA